MTYLYFISHEQQIRGRVVQSEYKYILEWDAKIIALSERGPLYFIMALHFMFELLRYIFL